MPKGLPRTRGKNSNPVGLLAVYGQAEVGTKPLQNDAIPSCLASLAAQCANPSYCLLSPWFMSAVRIRSKGLPVTVIASALHMAEQNVVRRSFRSHPVVLVKNPFAISYTPIVVAFRTQAHMMLASMPR